MVAGKQTELHNHRLPVAHAATQQRAARDKDLQIPDRDTRGRDRGTRWTACRIECPMKSPSAILPSNTANSTGYGCALTTKPLSDLWTLLLIAFTICLLLKPTPDQEAVGVDVGALTAPRKTALCTEYPAHQVVTPPPYCYLPT